jgi:hypothetical protein
MDVPGLYVAVNVLTIEDHKQLFQDRVFATNAIPFVERQEGPPLEQCICAFSILLSPMEWVVHGLMIGIDLLMQYEILVSFRKLQYQTTHHMR